MNICLISDISRVGYELTDGTYKTSSEAGFGYIKPNGYVGDEYKLLVRSFLIGINGIASSYPDYVKVITD